MTVVRIKLSQAVIDQEHAMASTAQLVESDPAILVDYFLELAALIDENYYEFMSYTIDASALRLRYTDGATLVYSGLMMGNPAATHGRASATSWDFIMPDMLELGVSGKFSYDYDFGAGYLTFLPAQTSMTFNGMRIATKLPSTSPDYDPTFGNVSMSLTGALDQLPSGELRGAIKRVDLTADKFIRSATIEGIFPVDTAFAGGESNGTLTGYSTLYQDGSLITMSGGSAALRPGEALEAALWRGTAGNDDFNVELPGRIYEDVTVAAGAGDDLVVLKGGGGRLGVAAGDGNDTVSLLGDRHVVDGGSGIDTVQLAGARADYVLKRVAAVASSFTVTDKSGATSDLVNVERLVFGNATVALDIDGNAGQAYRLYQAAFDRTPDAVGLGFWINSLDRGLSLRDIAAAFMTQTEFKTAYGSSQSNLELVTRFYQNILGRDPEAAGRDFWVGKLDQKAVGVAEVLAAISESAENKAGLVDIIGNGFTYTPWGGS